MMGGRAGPGYADTQMSVAQFSNHASKELSGSGSDGMDQDGSRKRKRPTNVTCDACKQRKVRCDRASPSCGWCTKNDHVCEYKERKKPGLRAGYGRELESRLDRLEYIIGEQGKQLAAHLQTVCPNSESVVGSDIGVLTPEVTSTTMHESLVLSNSTNTLQPSYAIDPEFQDSPRRRSFRYSDLNAPDQSSGQRQIHSSPSTKSHSLTSPHSTATFQQHAHSFSGMIAALPPYDLLYTLVDLYFKHVNVWLPLLDRKSTLDSLFGSSPLTEADRVLLHAIVATALRFCTDPRLTIESKQRYHTNSKQKVQLFGLENSSVRSLQASVILTLDMTGTTNGPPGWNMLSLISRGAVQLGLAAEATSLLNAPIYPSIATLRAAVLPEPKSCIEDEERRRLFWGVFLLDRYATVATSFEFALGDKEIDRRLPCRDDIFNANKSVETRWFRSNDGNGHNNVTRDLHGHFSHHCELLGILGRIHQFLKRPVDIESLADVGKWQNTYRMLDSQLNSWHFELPDDFANITRHIKTSVVINSSNCGWIMLHAAYNLTLIRLNSSAAYPAQTSTIFVSSYSAMQRCLSAVDNLKQLGHFVRRSSGLDKVGFPFAFAAWVAARVMLVHGSTVDHEVDPDIEFFVSLLAEMGAYWTVAQRYSEILSRVLQEYRSSRQSDASSRNTPSTVKILADMRRCAFDLDFLISRQSSQGVSSYHTSMTKSPLQNELEYVDMFDLFNFPHIPISQPDLDITLQRSSSDHAPNTDLGGLGMPDFAVPNPDADWLFNQP